MNELGARPFGQGRVEPPTVAYQQKTVDAAFLRLAHAARFGHTLQLRHTTRRCWATEAYG
jgi:hypothetical protein